MPILNPKGLQEVLRSATLSKRGKGDLSNLLEDASLSKEEVLANISSIMRSADSDGVRLRAAEMGAKLNGMLDQDNGKQVPVVNILIQDSQIAGFNPILFPR
jgi:hypothetical protein